MINSEAKCEVTAVAPNIQGLAFSNLGFWKRKLLPFYWISYCRSNFAFFHPTIIRLTHSLDLSPTCTVADYVDTDTRYWYWFTLRPCYGVDDFMIMSCYNCVFA